MLEMSTAHSRRHKMLTSIEKLREEVILSLEHNTKVNLWWRDDDLINNSVKFNNLVDISGNYGVPVLISIIPGLTSDSLDIHHCDEELIYFCQHGWKHINHELDGELKSEFGSTRETSVVLDEIISGQMKLTYLLGERRLPVFVPPWNTFGDKHLNILKDRGFTGLSTHNIRKSPFAIGDIRIANTHIDILRWHAHANPSMIPLENIIEKITDLVRRQRIHPLPDPEPIGLLSHHRAMDKDSWLMIDELFSVLASISGITWMTPPKVFEKPKIILVD